MQFLDSLNRLFFPASAVSIEMNREKVQQGGSSSTFSTIVLYAIGIAVACLAVYLCWQCNAKESTLVKVIYSVLSFLFSYIYLIYYLIFRIAMGNAC